MIKNYFATILICVSLYGLSQPIVKPISGPGSFCTFQGKFQTYSTSATQMPLYYTWSVFPAAGVVITNPNSSVTAIYFPYYAGGSYTVQVTSSNAIGTSAPAKKVVTVFETPKVTFTGARTFCQGSSTFLQASATTIGASSTISYKWSPAQGLNTTTGPAVVASPSVNTFYLVETTMGNCTINYGISIAVVKCVTALNYLGEDPEKELMIFPNPSSAFFNLRSATDQQVVIRNQLGQTLRQVKLEAGQVTQVEGLPPGLYHVIAEKYSYRVLITR